MPEKLTRSDLPRATNHISIGSGDARSDLGYGTINPKFHLPRSLNSSYPYEDDDPMSGVEVEINDDSISAVGKKSLDYSPTDHFSANSTDPFYFVAGNTKLSDCFWRVDRVLQEIAAFSDSISPIPQLSSRKETSSAGSGAAFPYPGGGGTNYRRTGTLQGWSKAPPPLKIDNDNDLEVLDKVDDTYTLEDIAKKQAAEEGLLDFHDT
jgi:hypothetical protein